jgi:hypothetical protein
MAQAGRLTVGVICKVPVITTEGDTAEAVQVSCKVLVIIMAQSGRLTVGVICKVPAITTEGDTGETVRVTCMVPVITMDQDGDRTAQETGGVLVTTMVRGGNEDD